MEGTVMCTVIAMDHTNLSYRACSVCERTLPDVPNPVCKFCPNYNSGRPPPPPVRFFRLLVSIATDTEVFNVMCFDRAARVLIGCSADEFFDFAKFHPFAAANAGKILEGEMMKMTLTKPKNGNAQHLRAAAVVPLRTGFQPAIKSLRELYKARPGLS
ncbi:unnamed protein product [Linum tenue]|uniref:Replication factor A C-terminal domain-containing protein n=1 Tax=Linum tenue TaxID=586396 RepID=A0AAV0N2U6_9ROSI|nr:unnamed protein product [Linum tenue]